jgi:hypothetical protein
VVVDRFGEVHFLGRQIQGAKTKDVAVRLKDFPLDKMPAVETVQQFVEQQKRDMLRAAAEKAREETARKETAKEKKPGEKTMLAPAQRRTEMEAKQKLRRDALDADRAEMAIFHRTERQALLDLQQAQNTGVASDRIKRQPQGLAAFLLRVTGIKALMHYRQDRVRAAEHREQLASLSRKHGRERTDLDRRATALTQVEKREFRSFQNATRRDHFRDVAREITQKREPQKQAALTAAQRLRVQDFLREARAFTRPQPETDLSATFNRAADGLDHHHETGSGAGQPDKAAALPELFNSAATSDAPENDNASENISGLSDAIRARSAQKKKQRERETGRSRKGRGTDRGRER